MKRLLLLAALISIGGVAAQPKEEPKDPVEVAYRHAFEFATQAGTAEQRLVAFASLGWNALEASRPADAKRAADLALLANREVNLAGDASLVAPLARLAVVELRLGRRDAVLRLFALSLEASTSVGDLGAWFAAAADAKIRDQRWGAGALNTAFEKLRTLDTNKTAFGWRKIAEDVKRLGTVASAQNQALELLRAPDLSLVALEELVGALEVWAEGPLPERVRQFVWKKLNDAEPKEIDEFVPPMIAAALEGAPEGREALDGLESHLKRSGHTYGALLARLGLLMHLSREEEPGQFADELTNLIESGWAHSGSRVGGAEPRYNLTAANVERMRVLYRAIALIPAFLGEDAALELIRAIFDRTAKENPGPTFMGEIHGACAEVVVAFPQSDVGLALVRETVTQVKKEFEAARSKYRGEGVSPFLVIETLSRCAKAASVSKVEGREQVVEEIARFAMNVIDRLSDKERRARTGGHLWFPSVVLIACAHAEQAFGSQAGARKTVAFVLKPAVEQGEAYDLVELIGHALKAGKAGGDPLLVQETIKAYAAREDAQRPLHRWQGFWGSLGKALSTLTKSH